MLINKTTVTEAIGDVDLLYNAVKEINITRYTPKEDRKIMTKHQLRYRRKIHHKSPKHRKLHKITQLLKQFNTRDTFIEFKK